VEAVNAQKAAVVPSILFIGLLSVFAARKRKRCLSEGCGALFADTWQELLRFQFDQLHYKDSELAYWVYCAYTPL
jgi:hypothetical protein